MGANNPGFISPVGPLGFDGDDYLLIFPLDKPPYFYSSCVYSPPS